MSADLIYDELLEAQQAVDEAQRDVTRAQFARDRLVVRARKTGMPATEIASLIGVNRARVYQILERAGLSA